MSKTQTVVFSLRLVESALFFGSVDSAFFHYAYFMLLYHRISVYASCLQKKSMGHKTGYPACKHLGYPVLEDSGGLFLYVTDVSCLGGVKYKVADRCNETVDSEGDHREEDVSKSS